MTTDAPKREPLQTSEYPFISIVMPCLNEKETVEICVRKGLGWLERTGNAGEVIVVDNGSDDGSPDLAAAAGAIVVHEAVRGYGAALRRGFREARGEWLVMGDCDDTYDFSDLDDLMAPLATGTDMVVGNRHDNIKPGAMTWSHRYIGTPVISMLLRMFTGLKVGDSQCGLRSFTREALNRMDLHTDGMELASEMVLKAARRDLKVAECGITLRHPSRRSQAQHLPRRLAPPALPAARQPQLPLHHPGNPVDAARHHHSRRLRRQRVDRDRLGQLAARVRRLPSSPSSASMPCSSALRRACIRFGAA